MADEMWEEKVRCQPCQRMVKKSETVPVRNKKNGRVTYRRCLRCDEASKNKARALKKGTLT